MFNARLLLAILSFMLLQFPIYVAEAATYYLPYYVKGDSMATGVGLTNLSTTNKADVTVKVYGENGTLVTSHPFQMEPNGQWSKVVGDDSVKEGWIQVESDQLLAGLCFALKDECMMDVPITEILSKKLIVPHSAQSTDWDTIVYIANPSSNNASVTLSFRDKAGNTIATQSISIPPMGSEQVSLADLLGGTPAEGGSVLIQSNQGVTGFALYNNRKLNLYWYAGINALPLEVAEFDGTWTGPATSIPQYNERGDSCGGETILSFQVYRNSIEGTGLSPHGEPIQMKGAITYDGSVYGIVLYQNEQVVSFTGNATGNQIRGEWFDFTGCYGPLDMHKQ